MRTSVEIVWTGYPPVTAFATIHEGPEFATELERAEHWLTHCIREHHRAELRLITTTANLADAREELARLKSAPLSEPLP
jgi:hypothetical protein